jgi:cyclic pyranopterin phosphate synthase
VFTPEDYGFISRVARGLGIKYYKLTGGEPLVRRDIGSIVHSIKKYAEEVSLVTNGSLLLYKARELADAGLDRVNVSLHSVNPEVYRYITGGAILLERVIEGIDKALEYGIRVKLNYLALRSNIDEFQKILEFAETRGLDLNVIELIPLGVPVEVYRREHVSIDQIINYLEKKAVGKYYRELQNRPVYILDSGIRVEVVVGYGNYFFCAKCTRIRLTPDGYLKPCLYVENPKVGIVDVVKSRNGGGLIKAFREVTMLRKPYFQPQGR